MDYVSIMDMPSLRPILVSMLQTFTIFALVLLGLKLVGRRVFAEQGPQDLITLVLIAEACNSGLSHQKAGYWGSVASVMTILFLGWLCERVTFIRHFLGGEPVPLFENGKLHRKSMEDNMVDESDLEMTAREYGLESYKDFSRIVLEGDGKVTGTVKGGTHRKHS